jgi:hypothetical protein
MYPHNNSGSPYHVRSIHEGFIDQVYTFQYDSIHRRYKGTVDTKDGHLIVNGQLKCTRSMICCEFLLLVLLLVSDLVVTVVIKKDDS